VDVTITVLSNKAHEDMKLGRKRLEGKASDAACTRMVDEDMKAGQGVGAWQLSFAQLEEMREVLGFLAEDQAHWWVAVQPTQILKVDETHPPTKVREKNRGLMVRQEAAEAWTWTAWLKWQLLYPLARLFAGYAREHSSLKLDKYQ
jgi:hypothetical protein